MPKVNAPVYAFNRGEISPLALARFDVERVRLSAEQMINFLPKTQGPMMLRPGTGFLGGSKSNLEAQWVDFVASTTDTALIEVTSAAIRVWVDDALVIRPTVGTIFTGTTFPSSAGWTDASENGGTLFFAAVAGNQLRMNATNTAGIARVRRTVTVAAADLGIEHSLKIVVSWGPVTFRCGTAASDDSYIKTTTLRTGAFNLTFTPTGDFTFEIESADLAYRYVEQCAIGPQGVLELPAVWAAGDIENLQWGQSADVIFLACKGYRQYRFERRDTRSWGVCQYRCDDGPFVGKTANVRLKPTATSGTTTLTADRSFFTDDHIGALFRLFHEGQSDRFRLPAEDTYTDPIRVSGVVGTNYNDRDWTYTVSGTWVGTLRVQRSFDGPDIGFQDYPRDQSAGTTIDITANASFTNEDEDDNSIVWYRIGFQPGMWTSGVAVIDYTYDGGGEFGICRIINVTNGTTAVVDVLKRFKGTDYTANWSESAWSEYLGWPTSVVLHEGRLWWFSGSQIFGSVSDDYESFDPEAEGDAGPIIRTIGEGPVDSVNFALSLQRLVIGTTGAEMTIKASSFEEALTPTNLSVKPFSTQGSKSYLRALKVDSRGIYIQRSGKRVFEVVFDPSNFEYKSADLTFLNPSIADAGIISVAVQRQPDTRVHLVFGDGTAAILTYEPDEEVLCWSRVETDGAIERAIVLPGLNEDHVYYHVHRTINGSSARYLEKWATEDECVGGTLNKQCDSFLSYSGASTSTINGIGHLNGKQVIVWSAGNVVEALDANNVWQPTLHTVSGTTVTLATATTDYVVGLPYTATYKSTKLAYAAQIGTALTQPKRVNYLGLLLGTTHHHALEMGPDFTTMDPMPEIEEGAQVATGTVHTAYDAAPVEFPGEFDTDSRFCLRAKAPRPVTVLAAVVGISTHDKA